MANSMNYWNTASAVKDELEALSSIGIEMYNNLECNDDPAEIADFLADIEKRAGKLVAQLGPNVTALRKAAKALDDIPGVKS